MKQAQFFKPSSCSYGELSFQTQNVKESETLPKKKIQAYATICLILTASALTNPNYISCLLYITIANSKP